MPGFVFILMNGHICLAQTLLKTSPEGAFLKLKTNYFRMKSITNT